LVVNGTAFLNKKIIMLAILTVSEKNSDDSHAGSVLFNSNRIGPFKTIDTDDTFFEYYEARHTRKAHYDKYQVDEGVAAVAALIVVSDQLVYALTSHPKGVRVTYDTDVEETVYIPSDEIAKAVAYGSDATKSWMWVEKTPGKLTKYLIDKTLETIMDYVNTGTTTTTTTTT